MREDSTETALGECPVRIPVGKISLEGDFYRKENALGVVVFSHGSGSSRHSPRNRYVARILQEAGLTTLLFDLLTAREEAEDDMSSRYRFDIELLTERLVSVTEWLTDHGARPVKTGYFGASTGAAAALSAAAKRADLVSAVVSRGGRVDLAEDIAQVRAPTLLIVGGLDYTVISLNQSALQKLTAEKRLVIVPGTGHLFEEPGALDEVAKLAADWFISHFRSEKKVPGRIHV